MRAVLIGAFLALAACGAEPVPVVVLLGADTAPWAEQIAARGWEPVSVRDAVPGDAGVRAIESAIAEAGKRREIDPYRTYIAGQGGSTSAVFYAVSRRPDLWAAALAAGGSPASAIETNRLFGANAGLVPFLWATTPQGRAELEPLQEKLAAAGFEPEMRATAMTVGEALDWLAGHKRDRFPAKVDCETGSPEFARCYWAAIQAFDPAQRNDVLERSRVQPGSGAFLALGGFGFDAKALGPGVLVSWLPPNYTGKLKLDDRIVAVGGKPVRDAREYIEFMSGQREERQTGVMILRGKERIRLESGIRLPKREESVTARVQAQYLIETHEMLVMSRGISALRLTIPEDWIPCPINWNGNDAGKLDTPGCWLLTLGAPAIRCR